MYLFVLLGLLGTFEMNFYGGAKRNLRTELEPKCVPHFLPEFLLLLFVRFLACPIVFSKFLFDFCPIFLFDF